MTDSNQIQQAITIVEKIIDGCVNIESNSNIHNDAKKLSRFVQKDCRLALTKLRQAIENKSRIVKECKETMADLEQAEQKPVAFIDSISGKPKLMGGYVISTPHDIPLYTADIPIYTAPQRPWVGLTEGERRYYNNRLSGSGVAEEIEAKLKGKNGG